MTEAARIETATEADIPAIVALLNGSYRGEASRMGWTTEADLIGGEVRTNEADARSVMSKPGSSYLLAREGDGRPVGCMNLQLRGDRAYFGMFAVRPDCQAKGLGRRLLEAGESIAKEAGCTRMGMWVISLRGELIAWYARRGYVDTGVRHAFEEDGLSGPHLRQLEFMEMEKML